MYSSSQVRSPHWNQYMDPLLLTMGSLSLGETSRFLMVLPPLKWVCMPYLPLIFLILSETFCVRYNNMTLGFNFIGDGLGTCSALVVSPISNLLGGPIKPFLHLVQSPFWVFTLGECLPEVCPSLCGEVQDSYTLFGPYG